MIYLSLECEEPTKECTLCSPITVCKSPNRRMFTHAHGPVYGIIAFSTYQERHDNANKLAMAKQLDTMRRKAI